MAGVAPGLIAMYEAGQDRRRQQILQAREDAANQAWAKIAAPGTPKGGDPASGGLAGVYQQPSAPAEMPGQPAQAPHPEQSWVDANRDIINQTMGIDHKQALQMLEYVQSMDAPRREQLARAGQFLGNAGMDVAALPSNERPAAWAGYVRQAEMSGMRVPDHYRTYSPEALRSAIAEANLTEKLLSRFDPKIVNQVPGTQPMDSNPRSAIDPFTGVSRDGALQPAQGGTMLSPEEYAAEYRRFQALPPEAQDAVRRANGSNALPAGSPVHANNRPVAPRSSRPDAAALRQQAQDAIARGADPAAVHARLRQMGVE